jgi:hypothetical protein
VNPFFSDHVSLLCEHIANISDISRKSIRKNADIIIRNFTYIEFPRIVYIGQVHSKRDDIMGLTIGKKNSSLGSNNNIMSMFSRATIDELELGKVWYQRANRKCQRMLKNDSDNNRHNLQTIVGMTAALSPRNKWSRNLDDVTNLLADSNAIVSTFHQNKTKALLIKSTNQPTDRCILDILGGDKVQSFYANIIDPKLPDIVTLDAHAISIWLGTRVIGAKAKGDAYQTIQQAYVDTAKELGFIPCQLQAITWLTYRRINKIQ